MSILNSERINFFGGIEVDVSVPNNEAKYPMGADGEKVDIFDPKTAQMTDYVYDNNITDEQIVNMFRSPSLKEGTETPYFTYGGWNIYGQHSVTTNQVKVRSAGTPGQVSTQAAVVDLPFYLLGSADPVTGQTHVSSAVMVDLNPLGSTYSQIVLGGIMLGSQDKPLLHLQGDRIVGNMGLYQKIINGESDSPGSSRFAGTWQVTFSKDEIVALAQTDSTAMNDFITDFVNTPGATGIVVYFSFFEMCPKMTTDQLRQSYGTNQDERNPSVGRIIGTIGLAFEGETAQYPDGRLLLDTGTKTPAYASIHSTDMLSVNLQMPLKQEHFRSQRDGYTADTLNPAIDAGILQLRAGQTDITTIQPDYTDYYLYGGIVDISLNADQVTLVQNNKLYIISPADTPTTDAISLVEQIYRIFSDDKDVYMGEHAGDQQEVTLQVRYLGKPIEQGVTLIGNVSRVDSDGTNQGTYLDLSVKNIVVQGGQSSVPFTLINAAGKDADAGWEQVQFSFAGQTSFVINTRKFQYSDFGIAAGATISWDQAYRYALRYHYLNFLGMTTVFPLNLAQTIQKYKEAIKVRTSSKYWPTTLYMPIVRSMSPSQVRLINAFASGTPWDPDVAI